MDHGVHCTLSFIKCETSRTHKNSKKCRPSYQNITSNFVFQCWAATRCQIY